MRNLSALLLVFAAVYASHHHHADFHSGRLQNPELRTRRDMESLMQKHLSWLNESQKEEIKQMKQQGRSNEEIKKKLLSFINDSNLQKLESCYNWLDDVASLEEKRRLTELASLDRALCRRRLSEYMERLSTEMRNKIKPGFDSCAREYCAGTKDTHSQHQRPAVSGRSRRVAPSHSRLTQAFMDNYIADADLFF